MTHRSHLFQTVVAPTLWVIGVVCVSLFAHHELALFPSEAQQSAASVLEKLV
jgi:hypothetical protein